MTKLTTQHFEAIARIIKARLETTNDKEIQKTLLYLSQDFADYFASTNGLFNWTRFVDACGFTLEQLREMR